MAFCSSALPLDSHLSLLPVSSSFFLSLSSTFSTSFCFAAIHSFLSALHLLCPEEDQLPPRLLFRPFSTLRPFDSLDSFFTSTNPDYFCPAASARSSRPDRDLDEFQSPATPLRNRCVGICFAAPIHSLGESRGIRRSPPFPSLPPRVVAPPHTKHPFHESHPNWAHPACRYTPPVPASLSLPPPSSERRRR
jgi:hypothetical protein